MKTINIKGKEYTPVHERILYFRENYKAHSIVTEIISFDSDVAVIKASIYNESQNIIATGHAFEIQSDTHSFVNKTSYLENAETSAIGRALGALGIGIDNSLASANEVKSAQEQQKDKSLELPWISELQYNKILDIIRVGEWPNKLFPDQDNPENAVSYLKTKYRMKIKYKEAIEEEIGSSFNKALSD